MTVPVVTGGNGGAIEASPVPRQSVRCTNLARRATTITRIHPDRALVGAQTDFGSSAITRCGGRSGSNEFQIEAERFEVTAERSTLAKRNGNMIATESRPLHVVVVGGGLAGLSSACVLAARGHRVTLLDKNDWVGGKAAVHRPRGIGSTWGRRF